MEGSDEVLPGGYVDRGLFATAASTMLSNVLGMLINRTLRSHVAATKPARSR